MQVESMNKAGVVGCGREPLPSFPLPASSDPCYREMCLQCSGMGALPETDLQYNSVQRCYLQPRNWQPVGQYRCPLSCGGGQTTRIHLSLKYPTLKCIYSPQLTEPPGLVMQQGAYQWLPLGIVGLTGCYGSLEGRIGLLIINLICKGSDSKFTALFITLAPP